MDILGKVIDEEKLVQQVRKELEDLLTKNAVHLEGTISPLSIRVWLEPK